MLEKSLAWDIKSHSGQLCHWRWKGTLSLSHFAAEEDSTFISQGCPHTSSLRRCPGQQQSLPHVQDSGTQKTHRKLSLDLKKLKGSPGLKCFYYGRFQDRHLCVNVGLFTCCRHPCILGLRVGKERIRMSWILRFTPRFVTVACFSETLSFLVEIYFGSAFNNPRSQDDSAMGF